MDNTDEPKSLIPKVTVDNSLTKKPLEWLEIADKTFTDAMAKVSAAIIQECDEYETMRIHDWVKRTQESTKMFQDNARERLLMFLLQKGTVVSEKGTLEIQAGGIRQRAIPTNTKPDNKLTEQMLRAKGLDINEWMEKELKYVARDASLKELLREQRITQAEYESCFTEKAYRIGASEPIPVEEGDEYD